MECEILHKTLKLLADEKHLRLASLNEIDLQQMEVKIFNASLPSARLTPTAKNEGQSVSPIWNIQNLENPKIIGQVFSTKNIENISKVTFTHTTLL